MHAYVYGVKLEMLLNRMSRCVVPQFEPISLIIISFYTAQGVAWESGHSWHGAAEPPACCNFSHRLIRCNSTPVPWG